MGLLNDDYFDTLQKRAPQPVAATPSPAQAPTSSNPAPSEPIAEPLAQPAPKMSGSNIDPRSFLSPEDQVKRYGGAVGSSEYFNYKKGQSNVSRLTYELPKTLGLELPDEETWDTLNKTGKGISLVGASVGALARMIRELPKEIVKAPIRALYSTAQPWIQLAKGEPGTFESLANEKPLQLPWLGEVPSYFKTYEEAKQSGMGPLAATLMTGSTALGDATIVGSLGEAVSTSFRPRFKLNPGEQIQNTAPIKTAIAQSENGGTRIITKAPDSVSEYYSVPKTTAKNFGGSSNDTYLKVTPAGSDSVEIAVVKRRDGVIPRAIDYVKEKTGMANKVYQGDFGPEVKVQSQIIKINPEESAAVSKKLSTLTDEESAAIVGSIPPRPLKGFEKSPITQEQLGTLEKIGSVNGMEPSIRDAVVRTITGKNVVGELTQAEYVQAAQTLSRFNNLGKFNPDAPGVNLISQYAAPQRHWMRTYEEKSGVPLYSEVYAPMEDAVRLRDVFRDSYRNEIREIFGKYAGSGTEAGEARRLISAYMRGEKDAILNNPALTPDVKAELVSIADKTRGVYDKVGPLVDVPTDIFLKDYQPRVQNIGGVYQLYKEGSEIPKQLDFFGKFKRKGDLQGVQIDDAMALFDIYINSGSNRTFLNPVLERVSALGEKLPPNLQGSVKSYVQEKMGYAGRLEEALDKMVPGINQKLGINLPPDAARQLTNLTLSTVYSGLLSSPATWFRQTFQYPLFGYARLGPKYAGEAIRKGLSKEGIAEAQKAGFLVDLGVPFGEELVKDVTVGGSAANIYKKATQAAIKPNSMADNGMRSIVYHQSKMQWDDALSRYNSGKITWDKLENELDFRAFSPVDQNMIRQKLVAGDMEGAFGNYVRDILDETNFPYRKAASGRITYGLGGKLGTSLLQWPLEAASTLGRWTKTGQWDKLIRYASAATSIQRTMSEAFDYDFSSSFFLGPFGNFYSPFVKMGQNFIDGVSAGIQNDREEFNKNKDEIVRTLKSAGIPAGVEIQNIQKFWKSYERGPDEDGQYAVLNPQGEVSYMTDFSGLFWGQLMGFPTKEKVENQNLIKDIRNAQFDRMKVKQKVLELYQREKYDEANELMGETGVKIGPKDFDDYHIPYTQRAFQSLPADLKAQFAPRVFNYQ